MKIYTVHIKPGDENQLENAVFVPEAFSIWAMIFPINFVWAIMHRAWFFLLVITIYLLSAFPQSFADHETSQAVAMVKLALLPFLGIFANDFLRWNLKHRGYRLEAVVSGKDESEAQLRYFESVNRG